jgi:signal transduction histidine kinase
MIGQIFLLSTLEAREAPPDFKAIDLKAFLRDCVEELRLSLESEAFRIADRGLDGPPCPVSIDPLQFRRVLENLVDNAARHGGRRSLALRIGLDLDGARARLEIEDNGRGISRQETERVFDRFYRSDPSRSGGGLGLGLAISKQIVEAHGGTISLVPGDEGGARFVVELPIAEART